MKRSFAGLAVLFAAASVVAAIALRADPEAATLVPVSPTAATPARSAPVTQRAPLPPALTDSSFADLVARLSEPGGYFDTDNLISNESSYLHVIGGLRDEGVTGGAYLGVGPDQNFSYIAAIRPRIAFIIDIRRDNLLEHLLFKALFERAPTRIEFLSLLFGRTPPADPAAWSDRTIEELVDHIDAAPADGEEFARIRRDVVAVVSGFGVPLTVEDLAVVARFHATFASAGPSLRYNSFGRAPRPSYPTYRQLLLATDRQGRQTNYLATEDAYRFVRELEVRNLIIPVVGDLAGDHALAAIADYLEQAGIDVSAFYTSNVEFYLWRDRTFPAFARNVIRLPRDEHSVIIRSLFGRVYGHPQSVPGYNSTQLLQSMPDFIHAFETGAIGTYDDLVYRGYIDLGQPSRAVR